MVPLAAIALITPCHADFDGGWEACRKGDFAGAAREWQASAEHGDVRAEVNLAYLYAQGHGVPQDCKQALSWFEKAAEQGNDYARYDLGALYYLGQCVPVNLVKAHIWFNLAAASGALPQAERARKEVAAGMTTEQIARALELAREDWRVAQANRALPAAAPAAPAKKAGDRAVAQAASKEYSLDEAIAKAEELQRRYSTARQPPPAPSPTSPAPPAPQVSIAPVVSLPTSAAAGDQTLAQADVTLGFTRHQRIVASTPFISQGEVYDRLKRVFGTMSNEGGLQPASIGRQSVFLLDDPEVNAFAGGGGKVYVTRGMMQAISGSEGMLAFVLGHEMAHNACMHGARNYLSAAEHERKTRTYTKQCGAGDHASCRANSAYQTEYAIAQKTLEFDQENEADRLGMQAAAEAGYHPDYAILAARQLRTVTGEQSKFAAYFPNHPRWTTCEECAERHYDAALALFESRWGSAQNSPGGRPPTMASVGPITVDKQTGGKIVRTAVRVRNVREEPVTVTAQVVGEHGPKPVVVFERSYTADRRAPEAIAFAVTKETLRERKGTQYVQLTIRSGRETLFESAEIRVK